MKADAKVMTPRNIQYATAMANNRVKDILARAERLKTDPDKAKRMEEHVCVVCFYQAGFIAGQAITYQPCMRCHQEQMYSSTATDALCMPCAELSGLCKHCGADIELKERASYPEPLPIPE